MYDALLHVLVLVLVVLASSTGYLELVLEVLVPLHGAASAQCTLSLLLVAVLSLSLLAQGATQKHVCPACSVHYSESCLDAMHRTDMPHGCHARRRVGAALRWPRTRVKAATGRAQVSESFSM